MKTQSVKLLDLIIRESLRTNSVKSIDEQVIPTKEDMKYSWNNNMTSESDQKKFRTDMRINYPAKMREIGLLSQSDVDKLDAEGKKKQLALLKQVWKTYGKEYLDVDDVNVDPDTHWYTPTMPKFIIASTILFTLLSLGSYFKITPWGRSAAARRLARRSAEFRAKIRLSRTELTTAQVDELVKEFQMMNSRGARKQYLKKILSKEINPAQAEQLANEFANNPALQNEVNIILRGEAAENFVNGKGVDAASLRKLMGKEGWEAEGAALKKRRAIKAKTTKKPKVTVKPQTGKTKSSTSTKAVTIKTMGKLKGSAVPPWTNLINSSATDDEIRIAVKKAAGGNYSLKTINNVQTAVKDKLSKKIGNKSTGAWILNKHLKAATFPEYITWVTDLKATSITRKLDETDYLISKTLWNLTK